MNPTAQHTAGPLEILLASRSYSNESNGKEMHGCIARDGVVLAYIPDSESGREFAPVFASAPELLAALKLALQRAECDLRMWPVKSLDSVEHQSLETAAGKYRAAIAKATGNGN